VASKASRTIEAVRTIIVFSPTARLHSRLPGIA
jgi:hypothetical protein